MAADSSSNKILETSENVNISDENVDGNISVKALARDYSSYVDVNINNEKCHLDESVEEMLTRLDEFCGLVDLIRSDTSLCIKETIPQIQNKSQQLEAIFHKIDKLEEFVGMVKMNLAVMEEEVNKAEDEMGSFSSIKKMFTSIQLPFMKKNSPTAPRRRDVKFDPPTIFSADDYFGPEPVSVKRRSKSLTEKSSAHRSQSTSDGRGAVGGAESVVEVASEAMSELS